MNNEELKREAEEKYFNHKMADFQGFYNHHYYYLGYIESAEPREKRIAELEKEYASLKGLRKYELNVAKLEIEKLEKENAELKEKLGDVQMQKAGEKSDLVWKLKTANEQKAEQLTEAKGIIEELYNIIPASMADYAKEPMEHARKFMTEEADK